jgi:photosystem II stability/assembly factor-like uncharacterized protein
MKKILISVSFALLFAFITVSAQDKKDNSGSEPDSLKNISLSGLAFRSIGPALTGGRVVALAVNPFNHSEYFVGAGHGSLWKTENNGITFKPVFDHQKSYSIGAVTIDPTNPNVIWVGTGENDDQNNVIYGDGVYKSEDGGESWENMGIKNSEHIGGIVVDPKNPNTVYVAAYGSLRNPGGDRGIYKTTDSGKTWKKSLYISEYTGCFEIHIDPRYSNILYAVAHQRMRKLYTGVYGGPESGIYRTTDGGATWDKMTKGLPTEDVGRIGLAISPVNPDVLYAIVEAAKEGGVYKSTDRGVSWTKQDSYVSAYPFYFQKLFCDTKDVDRVYSMDVFLKVSVDGGKTWKNLGEDKKHVDNHVLWIDPDDNKHIIDGCDGGVYETYDQGKNWAFKSNIPIAEIYKVTTDNDTPFYNVYAGSQDNSSFGGPSRTINSGGITNQDWFYTCAGDGFQTQVDWKNPNIIYSQSQNGGLIRFDKKSGERLDIKPYDFADTAYRFDWDAALLISKFDNKRLYFGGNKLFKTTDRGNTWEVISPDLTRGVQKEMQNLMDKSWSIDQLARKGTMAQISTIAESPIDENLLFTGSGDGLIYFTTDGGKKWNKSSTPGLPEYARISQIIASHFDKSIAYVACQNFIGGDYKPYLYKTTDGGKTWFLFNGNLPGKGSTYTIAEDDVDKDLLFVGTQFGVYFTVDGGKEWIQLKSGMPSECVMDLTIQRREHDLVVSTFGRGIYILDDYTPLRFLTPETLKDSAYIFPIKDALMFIEADPFAFPGVGFQGASFYAAPNPKVGAVFTYYLKDDIKSLKEQRRDEEKKKQKKDENIKYPSYNTLLNEKEEPKAFLLFTITDEQGNVVRKMKTEPKKGVNRIIWNFRYDPFTAVSLKPFDNSVPWNQPDIGYMVVPGKYKVSLSKFEYGKFTQLVPPQEFICKPLNNSTLPAEDKLALDKFNKKVANLTRAMSAADEYRKSLNDKLNYFKKAVIDGADVPDDTYNSIISIKKELDAFNRQLNGDPLLAQYEGASPTSVKQRVDLITSSLWTTTSAPTTTFVKSYNVAADQFGGLLNTLKSIDEEVRDVESKLEKYGAPYTPGRFPEWKKDTE